MLTSPPDSWIERSDESVPVCEGCDRGMDDCDCERCPKCQSLEGEDCDCEDEAADNYVTEGN